MDEEDSPGRHRLDRISMVYQGANSDESPDVTSLQAAIANFDVDRIEELISVKLFRWH